MSDDIASPATPRPYIVATVLNAPRRAGRRVSVDRLALAQLLGQLGKCGSNLNQIARALNSGEKWPAGEIAEAIAAMREAALAITATLRGRAP